MSQQQNYVDDQIPEIKRLFSLRLSMKMQSENVDSSIAVLENKDEIALVNVEHYEIAQGTYLH